MVENLYLQPLKDPTSSRFLVDSAPALPRLLTDCSETLSAAEIGVGYSCLKNIFAFMISVGMYVYIYISSKKVERHHFANRAAHSLFRLR